jgi:hypothetical protein
MELDLHLVKWGHGQNITDMWDFIKNPHHTVYISLKDAMHARIKPRILTYHLYAKASAAITAAMLTRTPTIPPKIAETDENFLLAPLLMYSHSICSSVRLRTLPPWLVASCLDVVSSDRNSGSI